MSDKLKDILAKLYSIPVEIYNLGYRDLANPEDVDQAHSKILDMIPKKKEVYPMGIMRGHRLDFSDGVEYGEEIGWNECRNKILEDMNGEN